MAKVSVIVPEYNVEVYLAECLDSILKQTLKDLEIICINDGSTDKSPEILAEYAKKDSRIIVINQENKGPGSARNKGLEIATGEYVAFVDSDDWIDKDYYEKLYNTAVKYNAEIACSGYKRCSEDKTSVKLKFKTEKIYTKTEDKYKASQIPQYHYVWHKIYKFSTLRMCNVLYTSEFAEDVMFSCRALYFLPKMVTVPETYYNYRKNNSSFVGNPNKTKQEYSRIEREKALDFILANNIHIPMKDFSPDTRIRCKIFNVTVLKINIWKSLKIVYLFGIEILKIVDEKLQ